MNTQNLSTLQVSQSFSHERESHFTSALSKRVYPVSLRVQNENAQRKPTEHTKTSRGIVPKRSSTIVIIFSKTNNLEARWDIPASEKDLRPTKVLTLPVINHFIGLGAASFRFCICVQQEFGYPVSYEARTSKVSTFTKSHVLNSFIYAGEKQIIFAKADLFIDKSLSCPCIELLFRPTLISNNVVMLSLELYCPTLLNNFIVETQTFQTFTLLYFTWNRWYISESDSESECQI